VNKKELVKATAKKLELSVVETERILNTFIDTAIEGLKEEKTLSMRGLFSMTIKEKPERRGINPHTLEPIVIPAHSSIKFKAGRLLREQVLEPVKVKPAKKTAKKTTKTAKKK